MSFLHIRKRHRQPLKIITVLFLILTVAGIWYVNHLYRSVFENNVRIPGYEIYLNQSISLQDLADSLEKDQALLDVGAFRRTLKLMKAGDAVVPAGHYKLKEEMSNREMINMFRSGTQAPVQVIVRKARLPEDLAEDIASQMSFSADTFLHLLGDTAFLDSLGLDRHTIMGIFLQDTYEMYWTLSPRDFILRMKKEYDRYWNEERREAAAKKDLTPMEVITLASIVEEETAKEDEKPVVAGLYLNRLRRGWRLQADPTVRFARGDFSSKRVYLRDLEAESEYNTYKIDGLPPGPICIPSKSSIEAVLHAAEHPYMYMCAKPDFSGYHNFARTAAQHERNRQAWIRALRK